jgi:tRNA C32,U32 (ribose-2'-O)-methylase TrmJ
MGLALAYYALRSLRNSPKSPFLGSSFFPFPRAVTPVAVAVRPDAESLVTFEHPGDALYVFGPKDGGLPKPVRLLCHRFVVIPTHHGLNLAAAVNVVLYDRRLKRHLAGREPIDPVRELLREHRGRSA